VGWRNDDGSARFIPAKSLHRLIPSPDPQSASPPERAGARPAPSARTGRRSSDKPHHIQRLPIWGLKAAVLHRAPLSTSPAAAKNVTKPKPVSPRVCGTLCSNARGLTAACDRNDRFWHGQSGRTHPTVDDVQLRRRSAVSPIETFGYWAMARVDAVVFASRIVSERLKENILIVHQSRLMFVVCGPDN
jgi:hypothetical protein